MGDDQRTPGNAGIKNAAATNKVEAERGHECSEFLDQLERLENNVD